MTYCEGKVSSRVLRVMWRVMCWAMELAYRNEEVRDLLLVLEPGLTILGSTPSNVTSGTVSDHSAEEDGIEPGERAPA